jgi:hypothetical protein
MALNDTLNDGGWQTGTSRAVIGGHSYIFDKIDHEKPTGSAKANNADGTPAGGAYVRMAEKVSVTIKARNNVPPPPPRVPFRHSFSGDPEKNWVVTTTKVSASNEGASITTFAADIEEFINQIPVSLS